MSVEYSNSQLSTFEQCPLQYRFSYVDGIKRREEGVEAFLGQRFHDAMEWLYGEIAFRVPSLEDVLAYYEKDWADRWHAEVKIVKAGRTADDYRLMGRRFIEAYHRRHHPFDEGQVLGLERYIRFKLDDAGRYRMKGIIDRLMRAPDGAFEIHDYKTGSKLPDQREIDADRQLALYQIGVEELWPEARESGVRLVWHEVAFDVEMRSTRSAEALGELKARVASLIDRIEAEREFPLRESALCGWCPYWDLCPAKKHLVKVEALPEEKWRNEPGVVIADSYAERWRKKRELEAEAKTLEAEMEALRQAAIGYAEKEGVQVIAGTDAKLRVTSREAVAPPKKGTEERAALEAKLRQLGLWDEVAALDPHALEDAVLAGTWGAEALAVLEPWIRTEKRWTLTVRESGDGD
ncbi:MAG TPA: PD-(D/E)XK nuclease family protein [Candidatus Aminicenantes bacterium]|nr:PD-(D/E)XK nuclease family protein [Candidatus Aminicenantes bacterium]